MIFNWMIITTLVCVSVYFIVMTYYYKSLLIKERASKEFLKTNFDDTEVVMRKLQTQLHRSLGNIDVLNIELDKVKGELTSLRTRNSQYRLENNKLNTKIKELEAKIESLL